MKKNITLSMLFFHFMHSLQSCETTKPTASKALFMHTLGDSSHSVSTLPEQALNLPLQFRNKQADRSIAYITFIGFTFSDGTRVYYPLPENPLSKKLKSLPKHPEDTLETIETIQIELNRVHFKATE